MSYLKVLSCRHVQLATTVVVVSCFLYKHRHTTQAKLSDGAMKYQEIGGVKYHVKGSLPQLVIHSGTHGDEFHVIEPLRRVVERMYEELPSFLYVPEVSPSAVALRTRENALGHDMNRIFWGEIFDPEVVANKQILSVASHAIGLTFHQDLENNAYYIYDSKKLSEEQLSALQQKIRGLELDLYTGFDDFEDDYLRYDFVDGYASVTPDSHYKGPFVDDWAMYHSHISRMLTVEMPFEKANIEEAIEATLRLGIELVAEYADKSEASVLQYAT